MKNFQFALLILWASLAAPIAMAAYTIDLDFRDATLAEVARSLASDSGQNIVTTEAAGKVAVNVFLQHVTVEQALDAIARVSGVSYRKDERSGVIRLMTLNEFQLDITTYQREETRILTLLNSNVTAAADAVGALFGSRVKLSAPTEAGNTGSAGVEAASQTSAGGGGGGGNSSTQTLQTVAEGAVNTLNKLTPAKIASKVLLESSIDEQADAERTLANTQVSPPPIYVTYNTLHNLLILRSADLEALSDAEKLIHSIDQPTRQVLLEMQVLEISMSDSFQSAVDLSLTRTDNRSSPPVGHGPNPLQPGNTTGPSGILGLGNFPTEGGTTVFQYMNDHLLARLQMAADDNRVRVLATPLLLASNNQRAELFIGEERILTTNVSAQTVTNENQTFTTFTTQTEKRNVGNSLAIVPRINADRTVTLFIGQDNSQILPNAGNIPVGSGGTLTNFPIDIVNTAKLNVTVNARDGYTVAVGGMIRERKSRAQTKVPFLGDIPGLGALFRKEVDTKEQSQLILVIRPHIIDTPDETDRARARVEQLSGENLLKIRRPNQPDNDSLKRLSERAVEKLDAPHKHPELEPLSLPPASSQDRQGLRIKPVAAWKSQTVYLTAVEVQNLSSMPKPVNISSVPGRWLAVTSERPELSPQGSSLSKTRVVLISEQSFEKAME